LPRETGPAYDRLVAKLDAIVVSSISTWDLLGLELHFLDAIAARRAEPTLIIYSTPRRVISLGRFHLYDGAPEHEGIIATRRLTGGRAVGAGEGWVGMALIAPSWGTLLPERDANIKPDQVMNRYARGLLAGLRALGAECFYPGRDAITLEKREIAMCTFDSDATGALLLEASIAVSRGMEELSRDLDRFDPGGAVPSAVHTPDTSTTLARALNRDFTFKEISSAILRGYAEAFGNVEQRELTADETTQAAFSTRELRSIHWLRRVAEASEYKRSGRIAAQLGQITARLGVSADNRIQRSMLSGDIIANSSGVAELEAALEGQAHELGAVSNAVTRTFANGRNFVLGLGDLANLVRLIANAQ
jgi:lipoate-protein ligase A